MWDSRITKGRRMQENSSLYEAALGYAKLGWHILPLQPGTKIPYLGSRGKNDRYDMATWPRDANIGLVPASAGFCVLDLDPGADDETIASLPPTYTVTSPRGEHRYYLSNMTYGNGRLEAHIDVRSGSGHVLLPPSMVGGVAYKVLDARPPVHLPPAVVAKLREKKERDTAALLDDDGSGDDSAEHVRWARWYLDHVRPDEDGWQIAAMLRRNCVLTRDTALALWEEWQAGRPDPWPEDEIRQKLANAKKYGANTVAMGPPGCPSDPATYGEASTDAPKPRKRFQARDPEEDALAPPMTYWDQEQTLPRGVYVGLAIGAQGSHKTGLFIKHGLDAIQQHGAKVLYVAAEGAHGIRTARLPKAREARNMPWAALKAAWRTEGQPFNLLSREDHEALHAEYGAWMGAGGLIFVDVLTKVAAGDINTPALAGAVMAMAQQLAERFEATLAISHHPGKNAALGAMGSNLFPSLADFMWDVSEKDGDVFVRVDKMKDGPSDHTHAYVADMSLGAPVVRDRSTAEKARIRELHPVASAIRSLLMLGGAYDTGRLIEELKPLGLFNTIKHPDKLILALVRKGELDGFVENIGGEGRGANYEFRRQAR